MKLFELTGIKSVTQEYINTIDDSPHKQKSSMYDLSYIIKDILAKRDFVIIGNGHYGVVAQSADKHYLVKIWKNDPAYLAFIEFCHHHRGNPYLPVFSRKPQILGRDYRIIRLEFLQPAFFFVDRNNVSAVEISNYVHNRGGEGAAEKNNITDPNLREILDTLIREKPNKALWDISGDNIMRRGDQLVITDPWFPGF